MVCAAVGTTLVLLSLGGVGGMFDALALIGASVAFAAAAIFLIVSIVIRRRRLGITYQPLANSDHRDGM